MTNMECADNYFESYQDLDVSLLNLTFESYNNITIFNIK